MATNGIEVTSVKCGPPTAIPLTDVVVAYDGAAVVLTLPGYLDRKEVERRLKQLCAKRTMYEYRSHAWRNAAAFPVQRHA